MMQEIQLRLNFAPRISDTGHAVLDVHHPLLNLLHAALQTVLHPLLDSDDLGINQLLCLRFEILAVDFSFEDRAKCMPYRTSA